MKSALEDLAVSGTTGPLVLKFGGGVLADGPGIREAVECVARLRGRDSAPSPVVVSALRGVTAMLERAVEEAGEGRVEFDPVRVRHHTVLRQLDLPGDTVDRRLGELRALLEEMAAVRRVDARQRDAVLSFGERMSARIFAAALRKAGVDALPVDMTDLDLVRTDERRALPAELPPSLASGLASIRGIAVVTGFIVLDASGHLATLGSNGSDLTATWLGAVLGAREVRLYKSVRAVLSADPGFVERPRELHRLSFEDAGELARHGASVLHPAAIEPARRAGVQIAIHALGGRERAGTVIGRSAPGARTRAIAHRVDVALLELPLEDGPRRARELAELFSALTRAGVEPYLGTIKADAAELLVKEDRWLDRALEREFPGGTLTRGLASIALVGPGLEGDERAEQALRTAEERGAWRWRQVDGPSRVLLAPRQEAARLVRAIHAGLYNG